MDQNKDIEELQAASYASTDDDDGATVDDFIKQLEAKERDLHITAETSVIEIAEAFDDGELPDALRDALDRVMQTSVPPAPAVAAPSPSERGLETEIESLKSKIAKMESDRDELLMSSQRRAKDFENFKARSERERKETFQNQIGNVATLMLPALDNLHRALDSAEHIPGEKSPAFQQFYEGIALVNEQITDILEKMGINPIRTLGEEFDPHLHEAVSTEETDEYAPGMICDELLRGYTAGDRVIRHSMVKVAKALPPPGSEPEPDGTSDGPELSTMEEPSIHPPLPE
jgi:molecular chaperone GrpE